MNVAVVDTPQLKAKPGCCEEASHLSHNFYIPCNRPATQIIASRDGELRMCNICADHSVRDRGMKHVRPYSPDPTEVQLASKGTPKSSDQQLVTIDPINALAIFSNQGAFDPILVAIREKIDAFVCPSMETKKGRDELRSFANDIAKTKTYLDDAGKILVRELKEIPGKVDATRKRMRDTLDQWKAETRAPLTAWEESEEVRLKNHETAIGSIIELGSPLAVSILTVEELKVRIAQVCGALPPEDARDEFADRYAQAVVASVKTLSDAVAKRVAYDAQQDELLRLRAAETEREAVRKRDAEAAASLGRERLAAEREARIATEAAENERQAAERMAQDEREASERRERALREQTEAAERRAADAEARAKREADEAVAAAERRAAEKASAERSETERREANKRHVAAVNRKARGALVDGGLSEDMATLAITLISARKIPGISVSY